jgi:DNA-directed RNA polymerase specialized sigma24 family protein
VRGRLVRFFEWRGAQVPEDLADETLERVARKLAVGTPIDDLRKYIFGVARFVAREALRPVKPEPSGALGEETSQETGAANDPDDDEERRRTLEVAWGACLKRSARCSSRTWTATAKSASRRGRSSRGGSASTPARSAYAFIASGRPSSSA